MNLKDQLQTMANGKNASYSAIADYLLARKSYAGLKKKWLMPATCRMRRLCVFARTLVSMVFPI